MHNEVAFPLHAERGAAYLTAPNIAARHAFSTRLGGVSGGVWASWNFGENRGDDPENVRENYRLAGEIFGCTENDFVVTKQVHEKAVIIAADKDRHTLGTQTPYTADGLVTKERGLPLMIYIADCVPVLLHDENAGVIGAVHCGWKSSVADILGVVVDNMIKLGARAEDIHAAIGASIGKCCFERDNDVPEAVTRYLGGETDGLFEKKPMPFSYIWRGVPF